MSEGLPDEQYVQAFLDEFGAGDKVIADVLGEPIAINDYLFRDANGQHRISKGRYIRLLARALREPDEVWAILELDHAHPGKYRLKHRYIARWQMSESEQPINGFSVFEHGQGAWNGNTEFAPDSRSTVSDGLEQLRQGVLIYRKPQNQK